MIRKFARYYRPHWKLFILDITCAFLLAIADLVYPYMSRLFIDIYIPDRNLNMMLKMSFFLLLVFIIRYILQYIVTYWGHVLGIRMEADMRKDLFSHLQTLSLKFYDNNRVGYLMSRIVNDLNDISELAHHGPEEIFISVITLLGSFIIMLSMNWVLALSTFLMVPIMIVFVMKLRGKMYQRFLDNKIKIAEVNSQIEESLSGIRVVKSFTNEDYEEEKFDLGNNRFRQSRENAMEAMAQFNSGINFFNNMIELITIATGGYLVYLNRLTVGELVAFLIYVNMFMRPIRRIANLNEQYQRAMTGFGRFQEILAVKPDIVEEENPLVLKDVRGEIEYRNVSFSYDNDSQVLEDINLKIKSGETIAFVGPSGAGKTTLCNLLPRFYEINKGAILLDGIDIRDLSLKSLRANIGIVQQDVFLFNGTIRDNIAYGKPGATDEEIVEAAKKAAAHDFIMELSNGYETEIGERGVKLSGGQKQRISIARTFLKNPPILILDEATSSLDNESERVIQQSLDQLAKGRTTLIIAHRLSTIQNADRIIVLAEEGIVQEGTHNTLINSKGLYRDLYLSQFDFDERSYVVNE
ncbi:MAG: ABC transporter ATP-binding protein [Halanaerobiales bacterium]|jgi:ATP-binding cassette subfamily B protein|nr:ABC transporter ATP-binding protein [Bacillota bacterium]HOA40044.1 ABC transporter ATP-binding protein [Halanaerobiales bacterium]HPZ62120.1 ABC transporter ATP-binding protein [Halanaerobiales bacterium]HQD03383.1 ABC transporter ATP-binding protein [Halanaerobiales bacterium]